MIVFHLICFGAGNEWKPAKNTEKPHHAAFAQNWQYHKNKKLKFHETLKNDFLGTKKII